MKEIHILEIEIKFKSNFKATLFGIKCIMSKAIIEKKRSAFETVSSTSMWYIACETAGTLNFEH